MPGSRPGTMPVVRRSSGRNLPAAPRRRRGILPRGDSLPRMEEGVSYLRHPAPASASVLPADPQHRRVRDQWHTMTRTAKAPRLMSHAPEPFVEIHPSDAARFGLRDGGLAAVQSRRGEVVVRVVTSAGQKPGSVFVPIHWTDRYARHGRVDALVGADRSHLRSARVEIHAGLGRTLPCRLARLCSVHAGAGRAGLDYWALARTKGGFRLEFAGYLPRIVWACPGRAGARRRGGSARLP